MRVLFIGGTGNISSACTDACLARGWEVYHLNRGNRSEKTREGVVTLKADINDTRRVKEVLGNLRFDAMVDWIVFNERDAQRDLELFEGRTAQYVFISTASAYEKPPRSLPITESTPLLNPFWEYSRDKIACEEFFMDAFKRKGFPVTIVRPSHTYGDGWVPTQFGSAEFTIPQRMIEGKPIVVPGDGTNFWTLTHTTDFAKGLRGLLGNIRALGEPFHITSDEALSWDEIYRTIGRALGVEPNLVHIPSDAIVRRYPDWTGNLLGDKSYTALFDTSKIKRFVPDFLCTTPFSVGLRRSLAWLEQHPGKKVVNAETNKRMDALLADFASLQ
jgi:nucleoside-diphosphate-sugar epimerase